MDDNLTLLGTLGKIKPVHFLVVAASGGTQVTTPQSNGEAEGYAASDGAANDGENSWKHRDYLVLETIQNARPDLIGYQEVLKFQAEFLRKNLKGYGFHGVGRDDGQEKGEYVFKII